MTKTALVTGITGQDGSYLAELLLAKGYRVVGHARPNPGTQIRTHFGASQHLMGRIEYHCFDDASMKQWFDLMDSIQPDEIYHLAAASSVSESWHAPSQVNQANIQFTSTLLEAVRHRSRHSKFFFACSSEVFGIPNESPQSETTAFQPCTPYGVTKAAGHWLIRSYRQRYDMFLCSGILFNHESPRRPESFVSRKITLGAVKIKLGIQNRLELGDLQACRDWGYAGDFVEAMWLMLQNARPDDFVIGTGLLQPTQRVVELAFARLELNWKDYVDINPKLFRTHDPKTVVANIEKARNQLSWKPRTELSALVDIMVQADMDANLKESNNRAA